MMSYIAIAFPASAAINMNVSVESWRILQLAGEIFWPRVGCS
jgi:hypothetical protein